MSEVQVTQTPLSDLTVLLSQLHMQLAMPSELSPLLLIFQHFAWDTWKLVSRQLDCMAASGPLVFTDLVNWYFLNKIITSVVDMLCSDKSPACMLWSSLLCCGFFLIKSEFRL